MCLLQLQRGKTMSLHNVQMTFDRLMKNPVDVVITKEEALRIYQIFYPTGAIKANQLNKLEYRAFLQAAMIGLLDGSNAMGWIQSLWKASSQPGATVTSIVKKLTKEAIKKYFKNKISAEPEIYTTVISAIKYGHGTRFQMIANGMSL